MLGTTKCLEKITTGKMSSDATELSVKQLKTDTSTSAPPTRSLLHQKLQNALDAADKRSRNLDEEAASLPSSGSSRSLAIDINSSSSNNNNNNSSKYNNTTTTTTATPAVAVAPKDNDTVSSTKRTTCVVTDKPAVVEAPDKCTLRYRNQAKVVSFLDEGACGPLAYAPNFLPGVHFFPFLACKEEKMDWKLPADPLTLLTAKVTTDNNNTSGGAVGNAIDGNFLSGTTATTGATGATTSEATTTLVLDDNHNSNTSNTTRRKPFGLTAPQFGAPQSKTSTSAHSPTTASAQPGGNTNTSPSKSTSSVPRLRMWVPDTIVFGETGRGVWIYTNQDGFVQKTTDFIDKHVLERLGNRRFESDPVVVSKESSLQLVPNTSEPVYRSLGNHLRVLSTMELRTSLYNVTTAKRLFVIQKFIKSKGTKAFIVRSIYEHNKQLSGWMINSVTPYKDPTEVTSPIASALANDNNNGLSRKTSPPAAMEEKATAQVLLQRLCTNVGVDHACTFVKLTEKGCVQVSELNMRIVKFLEQSLHIQLQTLVADFIKDTCGLWWLLQIKAFRVRTVAPNVGLTLSHVATSKGNDSGILVCALNSKLKQLYLSHREANVHDELYDDAEEDERAREAAAANLLRKLVRERNTNKLIQCKCCQTSYPKSELGFKMTLRMIYETMTRLQMRLPPETRYLFMSPYEQGDHSITPASYEPWSVCSYCYAIYERDRYLLKIEAKFSSMLGVPNVVTADQGLSRVADPRVIDPQSAVLPPHLTLCRMLLVFNAIYDLPKELVEAERANSSQVIRVGTGKQAQLKRTNSRLYLRFSALGYSECIPLDAEQIKMTSTVGSPRRVRRPDEDDDNDDEESDDDEDGESQARRVSKTASTASIATNKTTGGGGDHVTDNKTTKECYCLPLSLIRTIHFFAPRTPLSSKLKETSGIVPLLCDDNSVVVQLIRSTEPPLHDDFRRTSKNNNSHSHSHKNSNNNNNNNNNKNSSNISFKCRIQARKRAFRPVHVTQIEEMMAEINQMHHSVLLGSTKIRIAQFRSAYVTKLDFFASMAFSGELFNLKGNIGIERLRYVDTKRLTSQYRLRAFNGVFIPDDSYVTNDSLSPEWMDCLKLGLGAPKLGGNGADWAASRTLSINNSTGAKRNRDDDANVTNASSKAMPKSELKSSNKSSSPTHKVKATRSELKPAGVLTSASAFSTAKPVSSINTKAVTSSSSTVSGLMADNKNEDQDEELERILDQMTTLRAATARVKASHRKEDSKSQVVMPRAVSTQELLMEQCASRYDANLRKKQLQMPLQNSILDNVDPECADAPLTTASATKSDTTEHKDDRALVVWCLTFMINQCHGMERPAEQDDRWECHYTLFHQQRSGLQRTTVTSGHLSSVVDFTLTHKFFISGSPEQLQQHFRHHPLVRVTMRCNKLRDSSSGHESYACEIDLTRLWETRTLEGTFDLQATSSSPSSAESHGPTAYLSASIHLSEFWSANGSNQTDEMLKKRFTPLHQTMEGLQVLRQNV